MSEELYTKELAMDVAEFCKKIAKVKCNITIVSTYSDSWGINDKNNDITIYNCFDSSPYQFIFTVLHELRHVQQRNAIKTALASSDSVKAINRLSFDVDRDYLEKDADRYAKSKMVKVVNEFLDIINVFINHGGATREYGRV